MRRLLITVFVLAPSLVFAQAAPVDKFQWTTTDALAQASAFRWDVELDGAVSALTGVVCVAGTPVTCTAPIPAVTPGSHTARVRGVEVSGATPILGPMSDPLTFTMRATPAKPGNLTIKSGP